MRLRRAWCWVGIYTLARSSGIIAAQREIQTGGVYPIIRHPLSAGEALGFFGVVMQNPSVLNAGLFIVQSICQIRRIPEAEALLQKDESYAWYMQEVPWRLLPGLFQGERSTEASE